MLNDSFSTLSPDIPRDGLSEVLSRWSGVGRLYEALAAVRDESGRDWRSRDIEKRAHRILVERLIPTLEMLPRRQTSWHEILPVSITREKFVADSPRPGVSWPRSRRHGWPPRHFVGQTRTRHFSNELLESLAWTLEQFMYSWDWLDSSSAAFPSVQMQVLIIPRVLAYLDFLGIARVRPNSVALSTMLREGPIWRVVARIATEYLALFEAPLDDLAFELIWPDPEIRGRLFHLAVLGKLLLEIQKDGGTLISMAPIRESSTKPVYSVSIADETWDLWFEGAGVWAHYGHPSPYSAAMRGVGRRTRPLSPDILLLRRPSRALILECKHSANADYVCSGYTQVSGYANEVRSTLATEVEGMVVGPVGVVTQPSMVETHVGTIGAISPEHLGEVVARLLSRSRRPTDTDPG